MASSITLWGATYSNVPAVELPKSTSGVATFYEEGELITVHQVSSTPSSSLGNNGDIAIKVVG